MNIYYVGGFVRDTFMGVDSKDVDFAVEANSFQEMRDFISQTSTIFLEKPEYGTIRASHPKYGGVDYVLCRKDGFYSDGRRPDSVSPGTILDDLSRRDFTVNAIAINTETNEIFDPFDGMRDIQIKILRTVGKSKDRFKEDSLRLIRAIRFHITKDFTMNHSIDLCLDDKDLISLLKNISQQRIAEELTRCFRFDTVKTLEVLERYPDLRNAIFSDNIWIKPTMEIK
jgi:tRNA nucleotidyltransferase/poly(A) polymerase